MIEFILNDKNASTDLPAGMTVLDFVRYRQDLKGTKIGCREGDCGACTILVGERVGDAVKYRTMTSCLMPLANATAKHIVTIEGINPADGTLTPVQQSMVDESGTQCGFCTVGFVMSLTGFCIDKASCPSVSSPSVSSPRVSSPHVSKGSTEAAISAIDGNICRCTGYKSIERAARILAEPPASGDNAASPAPIIPAYFTDIAARLKKLTTDHNGDKSDSGQLLAQTILPVGGGTDVYVQRPDAMADAEAAHLFYNNELRGIRDAGEFVEIGASATVTDLLESPVMQAAFPDLYKHLKLVSSTPIRNMATLAGNFVNASPIGDMTVWFLALNAEITLVTPASAASDENARTILLRRLYLDYKKLDKRPEEFIKTIRFRKPAADHLFNFEKVCKRTYLDIATVNTAISLKCETNPGKSWVPPVLAEPGVTTGSHDAMVEHVILDAHVAAGGVAPVPLYLKETSSFLVGRTVNAETIEKANEIMQLEISPISDVRGTEEYKRLLLRQLFRAHFVELFDIN